MHQPVSLPLLFANKNNKERFSEVLDSMSLGWKVNYDDDFKNKLRAGNIIWAKKDDTLHLLDRGILYMLKCTFSEISMSTLQRINVPTLNLTLAVFAYGDGRFDNYSFSEDNKHCIIEVKEFPPHWEHIFKNNPYPNMTITKAEGKRTRHKMTFSLLSENETIDSVAFEAIRKYSRVCAQIYPATKKEILMISSKGV